MMSLGNSALRKLSHPLSGMRPRPTTSGLTARSAGNGRAMEDDQPTSPLSRKRTGISAVLAGHPTAPLVSGGRCWQTKGVKFFDIVFSGILLLSGGSGACADLGVRPSWQEVQAYLVQSLGCRWQGGETEVTCPLSEMRGVIALHRSVGAEAPDAIEINPVVVEHRAGREVEKYGQAAAIKTITYVLPERTDGPRWLEQALSDAKETRTKREIKVGQYTVLVQHLQPADVRDVYALVVITTRRSLDEWNFGDNP